MGDTQAARGRVGKGHWDHLQVQPLALADIVIFSLLPWEVRNPASQGCCKFYDLWSLNQQNGPAALPYPPSLSSIIPTFPLKSPFSPAYGKSQWLLNEATAKFGPGGNMAGP